MPPPLCCPPAEVAHDRRRCSAPGGGDSGILSQRRARRWAPRTGGVGNLRKAGGRTAALRVPPQWASNNGMT
eukprot:CAMPEP_0177500368 /NCGR_PEP_ID=MMETSP0369-20130122/36636_1 /TAXON_ID=447022 ORGANISM="Scrippsiella hangoei-like, Strain SHHI-4" /NCGR_SAMPLE_ID=MMETSP0369 /ASSEMBLY_ACC=CAM_ASM_000364 /LENGTH=71 /DNA_ID=CAMNT_0018977767 /DNA_START=354 /DNA_END=566 /DNA_ORIENTATION=-